MLNYFNKRTITINRETVTKYNGRLFVCIYQDNVYGAMKILGKSAFEAYMILVGNKDKFNLDYSPAFISQVSGMCLETARKALSELEEKCFLIKDNYGNYNFYETPKTPQQLRALSNEKREFVDSYGEVFRYTYSELVKIVGQKTANEMWENAEKC